MKQLRNKSKCQSLSCVRLFATPWTVVFQAPLSMAFSRQYYWGGLPFPFPGDLPNPGIEPGSPALQTHALPSEPPGKSLVLIILVHKHFYWSFRKLSSISLELLIDKTTYENHFQLISNLVEISHVQSYVLMLLNCGVGEDS